MCAAAKPSQRQGDEPSATDAPGITTFTLGPYATNCYVVGTAGPEGGPCWIVDASFGPAPIVRHVRSSGLRPAALILTHSHVDHIAGVEEVLTEFPGTPLLVHRAERDWLTNALRNLSALSGLPVVTRPADRLLEHGQTLSLGGPAPSTWTVLHTPGHSPGGIALYHAGSKRAIVGDALFAGSIGRTDFPGSDHDTLVRSIREQFYTLPEETRVYPGHGPPTSIGQERRSNPFVRP